MSSIKGTLISASLAYIFYMSAMPKIPESTTIGGRFEPEYKQLYEIFENVSKTERGGLSMVLMKKGEIVADLWAGYADTGSNQPWKENTLAAAYSTSKIYIGIIFTLLKREGNFKYGDNVSTIWPEFARNGKEETTILDILDHKAGLLRFSRDFTIEESKDSKLIGKLIEETTPQWQSGTKMGYSGLAYGYIIDQLVMRIDKKGRTAAQFFDEEIKAHSKDTDFYVGLPESENYRVARVSNPSFFESAMAHISHPIQYLTVLHNFISNGMIAESSAAFPSFLDLMKPDMVPMNSPDVRALPLISANGVGTARAMAQILSATARLLTEAERKDLVIPVGEQEDFVLTKRKIYGRGFSYIRHPTHPERYIISFWGNGLQMVCWDPVDDVVFVVFRNGLKAGDNGKPEMEEMMRQVFSS